MKGVKPSLTTNKLLSEFHHIKDWQALLLIAVGVIVFFRDILLQKTFFWEDFIYYFYPVRNFAAVSLASGEIPLWNPYTFNGMPFLADVQTAIFYIPNLLLTMFVQDGRLSFYWVELFIILHYILAGVGMYYVAKSFAIERVFALFSGLTYALSGFMIVHAIHQVIICQIAWLPLVTLLFRKTLGKRSIITAVGTGLLLGHSTLAGFPQLVLYTFFFLFLIFVFELVVSYRQTGFLPSLRMIPYAACVIVVAVGLTAIQWLPTLELSTLSQRAEISYEKSLVGSLDLEQIITLIVPKFFGASGAKGSNYWGPGGYYDYWETCSYIGIVGLIGAVFATTMVKRRLYVGFFAGIALFSLLYAFGESFFLHRFFFHVVPGFERFRNPARMMLLFTFSVALLSGFGFQLFFQKFDSLRRFFLRMIGAIGVFGLLLWIGAHAGVFHQDVPSQAFQRIHPATTAETTTAFILILVSCGMLFMIVRGIVSKTFGLVVLLIVQFVDMHVFGFDQNNSSVHPDEYFGQGRQIVRSLKEEGKKELFRVNVRQHGGMVLDRNTGMLDRIFLMEGYTPLVLQNVYPPARDWDKVCDLLNAKYRVYIDEKQNTRGLRAVTTYLPRAYFVYDAITIPEDSALQEFMRSDKFDPRRSVVLEKKPTITLPDTIGVSDWFAKIVSYKNNVISLDVYTPKNGVLVLSEIFYPGWVVVIDGEQQEVYRANWNLRAVPVSAGHHQVEFRFEPRSYRNGMWVTLGVLVFSVGCTGSWWVRRRKTEGL